MDYPAKLNRNRHLHRRKQKVKNNLLLTQQGGKKKKKDTQTNPKTQQLSIITFARHPHWHQPAQGVPALACLELQFPRGTDYTYVCVWVIMTRLVVMNPRLILSVARRERSHPGTSPSFLRKSRSASSCPAGAVECHRGGTSQAVLLLIYSAVAWWRV